MTKNLTNLGYHFIELRYRLLYLASSLGFAFLTSYFYSLEFLYLFLTPCTLKLYEKGFIFTEPTEAFYTTMKICFMVSLFILLPFLLYQLWCFLAPSWYFFERKIYKNYILFYNTFLMVYICLIHFYFLPEIFRFLLFFEIESSFVNIQLLASYFSYFSLASRVILFGLFLMAIVCSLIYLISKNWEGTKPENLSKNRKIVFFFSSLFSAFLAPPEVIVQLLLLTVFMTTFEYMIIYGYYHSYKNKIYRYSFF